MRIIRDTGAQAGAEGNLDAITILHIPAKVYPNGSINFEYDFMQPGKFVGLVTVGDKEEYVSRFPFSVGEPKGTSPYLIVAIAAIIGAAAVFFLRGRRKPPNRPSLSTGAVARAAACRRPSNPGRTIRGAIQSNKYCRSPSGGSSHEEESEWNHGWFPPSSGSWRAVCC